MSRDNTDVTTAPKAPQRPDFDIEALRSSPMLSGGPWRRMDVVAETGSTNADLLAAGAAGERGGMVLLAEYQHGGRGRLDRSWSSPARADLLFSVLVDCAGIPAARWSWLPLLTGLAVRDAVRAATELDAVVKWPNDVLIGATGRKLSGILVQAVPGREQAVIGVAVNVTMTEAELPVPTATSLLVEGSAELDRPTLLAWVLSELGMQIAGWRTSDGDPLACGLLDSYIDACATLDRRVRVSETSGEEWTGIAASIDADGRLEVRADADGAIRAVGAADVVHLRSA